MISIKKRWYILFLIVFTVFLSACNPASNGGGSGGGQWPVSSIEVIVPANAGGDTDFNARTLAKYFEELTGVDMVVTNMAGAGGTIATNHVKDASSDGSMLLFSHTGQLIVNEVSGLADYGYRDFDIVCIPAVDKSSVFAVNSDLPIKNIEDLVELAKKRKVNFGTEFGSTTELQALVLEDKLGVDFNIIDSGGASERVTELLGGRIDVTSIPYGTVQDHIQTGDMLAIGQLSGENNELIEGVKTVKEQGYGYDMEKPYIAAYPKGTDEDLVLRTSEVIEKITEMEEYKKELEENYKQPVNYYNREESLKILGNVLDEYKHYEDVLKR